MYVSMDSHYKVVYKNQISVVVTVGCVQMLYLLTGLPRMDNIFFTLKIFSLTLLFILLLFL